MPNLSGIQKVQDIMVSEEVTIYDLPKRGRKKEVCLEEGREYIVPEYQREIAWSTENVQILIDDLKKGHKFLGTITLSTSQPREFEIIDGQQRLTVITLIITCLNEFVSDAKKIQNLCNIDNKSFPFFQDALAYRFDYEKIKQENLPLYNNIIFNDYQNQKLDFTRIWKSIEERINLLSSTEKENLLLALCESEFNVIVNEIEEIDTQRQFCVDYFIDINNKSVELDSLDIIRAYAFKEDFNNMTSKWVQIQKKCNALYSKVGYTREELYYQYFVCKVNKEIEYTISKLSDEYKIKEDVEVFGKKFASGTYIWNMFKNDKFYSQLLEELDEYLDFIETVLETENGGEDNYKKYFYDEKGELVDETRILNSHTIINSILRNEDMVPKMMVMKYFFEVLKPERTKYNRYKIISSINIIATVFTFSSKRKGSEIIASKLLLEDWQKGIREYATKIYQNVPKEILFDKVIREESRITGDSGLHAARRYFSLVDACEGNYGSISINENIFKIENNTSGDKNMEHFIINRGYSYALYLEDGEMIDIEINVPKKFRKNIATIANYIMMNAEVNGKLKNRPVYEKVEMLEEVIGEKGIDVVIPSKASQRHFYAIKKCMHDESKYPKKKLCEEPKKSIRKKLLKTYYQTHFDDEYKKLILTLRSSDLMFLAELEYELKRRGFHSKENALVIDQDSIFSNVQAEIDEKKRTITMSAELYNPAYGEENGDDVYDNLIEQVNRLFVEEYKEEPEIQSSLEYCDCPDESIKFMYTFEADVQNVEKFIDELSFISSQIL